MAAESSCLPGRDLKEVLGLCIAQGIGGGTPAFLPAEGQQNGLGSRILVGRIPDLGPGMMKLRQISVSGTLGPDSPAVQLRGRKPPRVFGMLYLIEPRQGALFPARMLIH